MAASNLPRDLPRDRRRGPAFPRDPRRDQAHPSPAVPPVPRRAQERHVLDSIDHRYGPVFLTWEALREVVLARVVLARVVLARAALAESPGPEHYPVAPAGAHVLRPATWVTSWGLIVRSPDLASFPTDLANFPIDPASFPIDLAVATVRESRCLVVLVGATAQVWATARDWAIVPAAATVPTVIGPSTLATSISGTTSSTIALRG